MLHFLLIDDNTERRTQLSDQLRKEGAVVSEAETVAQGIEFSRRTEIDAFVINTPAAETEGRCALESMRAVETMRREGVYVPVMLLADRWDERTRAQCQARGAQLLKKTALPKTLLEACATAV